MTRPARESDLAARLPRASAQRDRESRVIRIGTWVACAPTIVLAAIDSPHYPIAIAGTLGFTVGVLFTAWAERFRR